MRLSEIVLYPLCKPPGYYQRRKAARAALAAKETGKAKELKSSASINVRKLFDEEGTAALNTYLLSLSVDELKAIIKKERYIRANITRSWKNNKRLARFILESTYRDATRGDAFRETSRYKGNPKYELPSKD